MEYRMKKWNVYLRGEYITSIWYIPEMTGEEVKTSLVNHDGYSNNIEVREELTN